MSHKKVEFQVVEKTGFGTDWSLVRYDARALDPFPDRADAHQTAMDYLTQRNASGPLTTDEKAAHFEAFMETEEGQFVLGVMDGKPWVLIDEWGKVITDREHWKLRDKTEVAVREIPKIGA